MSRWIVAALRAALCGALLSVLALPACSPKKSGDGGGGGGEVVLYYSADDHVAKPVIEAFEQETGITVRAVGDTEATKTTGLVQRLRAERGAPRADVFWSSEVFLTIALADEGLLAPLDGVDVDEAWPGFLTGDGGMWRGFALRARVIAYNDSKLGEDETPIQIADLAKPEWKDRVVLARPAFGTTRGHIATIYALWGEAATRAWLTALKANGARLLDGNSAVVRAIAMGEADVGLTDSDDVWAAQREGWPIELRFARHAPPGRASADEGPLVFIPNTVALVAGGPNRRQAQKLAAHLLSAGVERTLALSDSHNVPWRGALAEEIEPYIPGDMRPDDPKERWLGALAPVGGGGGARYEDAAEVMDAAVRLVEEVFGA